MKPHFSNPRILKKLYISNLVRRRVFDHHYSLPFYLCLFSLIFSNFPFQVIITFDEMPMKNCGTIFGIITTWLLLDCIHGYRNKCECRLSVLPHISTEFLHGSNYTYNNSNACHRMTMVSSVRSLLAGGTNFCNLNFIY